MSKRQSVTLNLKTAKKLGAKRAVMASWSSSLASQTDELTRLAWNAAQEGNMAAVTEHLKELRYLISRAMDAVPRITNELLKSTPEMSGDEMKKLDEMAEKRCMTRAELMREMLDEFFENFRKNENSENSEKNENFENF